MHASYILVPLAAAAALVTTVVLLKPEEAEAPKPGTLRGQKPKLGGQRGGGNANALIDAAIAGKYRQCVAKADAEALKYRNLLTRSIASSGLDKQTIDAMVQVKYDDVFAECMRQI